MRALEAIRNALGTLRAQWLRTLLTLFGLVWGTASVIFLLAWGGGVKVMLEHGYDRVGKNLVQMWPGRVGEDFTPAVDRRHLWFTRKDVDALRQRSHQCDLVLGEVSMVESTSFGQTSRTSNVRGIEPEAFELRGVGLTAGRMIREGDLDRRGRVAVIGAKIRRELMGPRGRIGSSIRIQGRSYEVVGFLEEVGTQFWQDGGFPIDEQIWIPLTTAIAIRPSWGIDDEVVTAILARVRDRKYYDAARREIRGILAERLGVSADDREAILIGSPIDGLRKLPLDQIDQLLFMLGATTLLIGGIGILNMMLDSVQERRQEIGVRLAVGARRRDILVQFFLETLTITAVGGGIGLALGLACCWFLASIAIPNLIPVPILTKTIVASALICMSAVGFLSGLVPAWRAARVDPSVTLRAD